MYIGETGRDLTTRLNEHKAHDRRGECDKSAIIKHSTDSDHVIDWQKAEIIAPEKHWYTVVSERLLRSTNTTLFLRTSAISSAAYGIRSYHPSTLTPHSLLTRLNEQATHSQQATHTQQASHTHTIPRWQPIKTHHTTVVASDTLHRAPIRTLPIQHIIPADTT